MGGAGTSGTAAELAARLHALVDRAPGASALLHHRLGAIAAPRWRERGRELPAALVEEEQFGAVCTMTAPLALERIADVCDAPLLLLKGPEVASRHPNPQGRPYRDLDLLAENPRQAFDALVGAGAEVVKKGAVSHHELPLVLPGLPLVIEVHREPKWPAGLRPPGAADLLAGGRPSQWAGGRILAPLPSAHAVLLAAHAWAHRPLRRLLDLVDVLVLVRDGDGEEAGAIARTWGVERLWRTTLAAAEALLGNGPPTWPLRSWARNLPEVRERSGAESRIEALLAPFAALPPRAAARRGAGAARRLAQDSRIVPRRRQ